MLGATFASMFPDRVGRLILDGVGQYSSYSLETFTKFVLLVDADGFVGPLWTESSWDTNKVFDSFATYCHKAGKRCHLYEDVSLNILDC